MSLTVPNTDASATSLQLAARVAEVAERLQAGELVDVEALCADCPEHVEQLKMLLPTLEAVVDLEQSLAGGATGKVAVHATSSEPHHGQLGDFRIVREIGRGGMGVVYEAEEISLGRRVALKVLPLAATLSTQQLERFKNESRAAATLRHPHIVGIYSVGVERGVHYYAMELIQGHSLAQLIEAMRLSCSPPPSAGEGLGEGAEAQQESAETHPVAALSTARTNHPQEYYRQATRLIADAADALHYAHDQGIVHRDIKPANLLVDNDAHIWITDFGLARLESDAGVTLTGDLLGTLRYMSPEQAAGKPALVDYRTDIHALGATLYELLTLQPAFDSADRAELLHRIASDAPPALRRCDPRIPTDLEIIVSKASGR